MPTTLSSLLIFVVLLLPGFAYLVGKERHGTERHTSPFRETVAVVAASVTTEVVILAGLAILRWGLPSSWTPDVGALIRSGHRYATVHYHMLAAWGFSLLALAVLIAYFATVRGVRKRVPGARDYPHASTVSAWWLLFEKWPSERDVQVTCTLDDGSAIRGLFQSFNTSADDSPDRDLILKRPIKIRQPGESQMHDFNARYACLSARRVVTMFVSYPPPAGAAASVELQSSALEDPPSGDRAMATHLL